MRLERNLLLVAYFVLCLLACKALACTYTISKSGESFKVSYVTRQVRSIQAGAQLVVPTSAGGLCHPEDGVGETLELRLDQLTVTLRDPIVELSMGLPRACQPFTAVLSTVEHFCSISPVTTGCTSSAQGFSAATMAIQLPPRQATDCVVGQCHACARVGLQPMGSPHLTYTEAVAADSVKTNVSVLYAGQTMTYPVELRSYPAQFPIGGSPDMSVMVYRLSQLPERGVMMGKSVAVDPATGETHIVDVGSCAWQGNATDITVSPSLAAVVSDTAALCGNQVVVNTQATTSSSVVRLTPPNTNMELVGDKLSISRMPGAVVHVVVETRGTVPLDTLPMQIARAPSKLGSTKLIVKSSRDGIAAVSCDGKVVASNVVESVATTMTIPQECQTLCSGGRNEVCDQRTERHVRWFPDGDTQWKVAGMWTANLVIIVFSTVTLGGLVWKYRRTIKLKLSTWKRLIVTRYSSIKFCRRI